MERERYRVKWILALNFPVSIASSFTLTIGAGELIASINVMKPDFRENRENERVRDGQVGHDKGNFECVMEV